MTFWTWRGLHLSYTCAERRLPANSHIFSQSPFPTPRTLPMPRTALLFYSLSHKYPELPVCLLGGWFEICSPVFWFDCLANKPSFCCKPRCLRIWLAVRLARQMWFGNPCGEPAKRWVRVDLWPVARRPLAGTEDLWTSPSRPWRVRSQTDPGFSGRRCWPSALSFIL